jgi:hypothetical protein
MMMVCLGFQAKGCGWSTRCAKPAVFIQRMKLMNTDLTAFVMRRDKKLTCVERNDEKFQLSSI